MMQLAEAQRNPPPATRGLDPRTSRQRVKKVALGTAWAALMTRGPR
jgi:hypothetical protein